MGYDRMTARDARNHALREIGVPAAYQYDMMPIKSMEDADRLIARHRAQEGGPTVVLTSSGTKRHYRSHNVHRTLCGFKVSGSWAPHDPAVELCAMCVNIHGKDKL